MPSGKLRQLLLIIQRIDGVAQDLRGLFVPHRQAACHQHRQTDLHICPALVDGTLEAQQLYGSDLVLYHHIGHEGVVLCGACFVGGHYAGHDDLLPVCKADGASLLRKILQNVVDGRGAGGLGQLPIVAHGMTREIQPRGELLHVHFFHGGKLRNIRQTDLLRHGGYGVTHVKNVQLPLQILSAGDRNAVHHRFKNLHKL